MKRAGDTVGCAWAERVAGCELSALSEEALGELIAHAETCEACQRLLSAEDGDGWMTEALREAALEHSEQSVDVAPPLARLSELLPDYEILGELGRGGMGVVYRARQRSLDRIVALKILPAILATVRPTAAMRFRREAALAARLSHTHIISVYEFGESGGTLHYAMELVEGRTVRDLLDEFRERGGVSFTAASGSVTATGSAQDTLRAYHRQIAAWAADVANALQFAHDRGVLHRDIKPSNLIVGNDGRIKITDFGLARPVRDAAITATRSIMGTVRYMAPERIEPSLGAVDARSDVYGLGATLHEMLTLRPVFDGDTDREVMRRLTEEDPGPPSRLARHLPAELSTICHKAIARRPADRYTSALAMEEDLRRWLLDLPIHARPIGPVVRAWRGIRRRPVASGLAACVAVLAVLTGSFGASAWSSAREAERVGLTAEEFEVRTLLGEGRKLFDQADLVGALRLCDEAEAIIPGTISGRLLRANILTSLRKNAEAIDLIESVVADDPTHADARMKLGLEYAVRDGEFAPLALEQFAEVVRLQPEAAVGYFARAKMESDHSAAIALLDTAISLDNQRFELVDERAYRNFRSGDYKAQLADAQKLVAMQPRRGASHRRHGIALAALQRFPEADAALTEAIRLDPIDYFAWHNRSQVRAESDRLDEAIADAMRVLELKPGFCSAYNTLSKAKSKKGQLDAAFVDVEEGLRCNPSDPQMVLERGRLHYLRGELEAFVADASRAIQFDPMHANAYNFRAVGLNALGRYEEAIADIRHGIELSPGRALDYVNLGQMYSRFEIDRQLDAAEAFGEAAKLEPGNANHLVSRGEAYWRAGEPELAIADLIRAEELGSQDVKTHLVRGWAYWELGLTDLAVESLAIGAEADPSAATVCRSVQHLVLMEAGRHAEAMAVLDPGAIDAEEKWLLVVWRHLRGEIDPETMLEQAGTPNDRAQALYYAGAHAVIASDTEAGTRLLRRCIETEGTKVIEHPAAKRMLARLTQAP